MICIKKLSCNKWSITDTTGQLVFTGSVKNIDGTLVKDFTNPGAEVTLPGDGVYIITIVITDNSGESTVISGESTVITTNLFPIFDFCNLFACVKKLLLEIWCREDICCDGCDDKTDQKKRHELNKMMAAYMTLMTLTYAESFTFFGLTCISDARMVKINEINALYKTLKKIVENCGACKGTISANTQPCKSC